MGQLTLMIAHLSQRDIAIVSVCLFALFAEIENTRQCTAECWEIPPMGDLTGTDSRILGKP